MLKVCDNYKWNFNNTKLSSLSKSEQKIIIPHLKNFTVVKDANGINRVVRQFQTTDEVANFVLEGKTEKNGVSYYIKIFETILSDFVSAFCFLFRKDEICELNDARAKILSVNVLNGIFYGSGVQIWLDNICKNNKCKLENIHDFVVAELTNAACNDEMYDFSYDINFSSQKSEDEKDRDLKIENLLNFLVDRQKQKAIADFNNKQEQLYKPTSNKTLRALKITVSVILFLSLGLVALSLWLVSLVSVTFCFIELGLLVFSQIVTFIAKHLSEDNRIGKIIKHKYTQYFLGFLQLPIVLLTLVVALALGVLLGSVANCGLCCVACCCPPVFNSDAGNEPRPELDIDINQNQFNRDS